MSGIRLNSQQTIDYEVANLKCQLENANESGQEVVSHLQDTTQDPSAVIDKVDDVNSQWDELQAKLQELRDHVKDKVSPGKMHFSVIICSRIREKWFFGLVLKLVFLPAVSLVGYVTVTLFV